MGGANLTPQEKAANLQTPSLHSTPQNLVSIVFHGVYNMVRILRTYNSQSLSNFSLSFSFPLLFNFPLDSSHRSDFRVHYLTSEKQ